MPSCPDAPANALGPANALCAADLPESADTTQLPLTAESLEGMIEAVVAQAAERILEAHESQGGLIVSKAWIFKRPDQVKKYGEAKASWYVAWIEPGGRQVSKSCGPGKDGRRNAQKLKRHVEAQLLTGTYGSNLDKPWTDFRWEYEEKILPGLSRNTRKEIRNALSHFERIVGPGKMSGLKTIHVDAYKAGRRTEPGLKPGSTVSPCTLNKEARHLKAAIAKAVKWGYLKELPDFAMEREPKKIPRYVTPEDFADLYAACRHARLPKGLPYPPADWWRGLLTLGYMSGWRIAEMLTLPRADVNLETGETLLRHDNTKGKADAKVFLHPVVTEHLRRLSGFTREFFPWPHRAASLYRELHRLCDLAGTSRYGFHDLRRAFATCNADRMTADALQALMRHQSYSTTQRYITLARQLNKAVENLFVPEILKDKTG